MTPLWEEGGHNPQVGKHYEDCWRNEWPVFFQTGVYPIDRYCISLQFVNNNRVPSSVLTYCDLFQDLPGKECTGMICRSLLLGASWARTVWAVPYRLAFLGGTAGAG